MLNHKYGQGMKRQSQAAVGSSTIGSHKSSGSSRRQAEHSETYNDASQFAYLTSKAAHSGSSDSAFIQPQAPSEYDTQSRKLDFSFSNQKSTHMVPPTRQPQAAKADRVFKQLSPASVTSPHTMHPYTPMEHTSSQANVPGIGRNKRLMVAHPKLKQPAGKDAATKANKGQTIFKNYGASSSGNSAGSKKSSSNGSKGSQAPQGKNPRMRQVQVKSGQKVRLNTSVGHGHASHFAATGSFQNASKAPVNSGDQALPQKYSSDYGFISGSNVQLSRKANQTAVQLKYQSPQKPLEDQIKKSKKLQVLRTLDYTSLNHRPGEVASSLLYPQRAQRNNSQQENTSQPGKHSSHLAIYSPHHQLHNSQEPRHSSGQVGRATGSNAARRAINVEDDRENKLRQKKKLLMSDSLNMLTKQRNQFMNQSINNSNNSSKNRKEFTNKGQMKVSNQFLSSENNRLSHQNQGPAGGEFASGNSTLVHTNIFDRVMEPPSASQSKHTTPIQLKTTNKQSVNTNSGGASKQVHGSSDLRQSVFPRAQCHRHPGESCSQFNCASNQRHSLENDEDAQSKTAFLAYQGENLNSLTGTFSSKNAGAKPYPSKLFHDSVQRHPQVSLDNPQPSLKSIQSTSQSKNESVRFTDCQPDTSDDNIPLPSQIHNVTGQTIKPLQTIGESTSGELLSRREQPLMMHTTSDYVANNSQMNTHSKQTTMKNTTTHPGSTKIKKEGVNAANQGQSLPAQSGAQPQIKRMMISKEFIEKFKERQQPELTKMHKPPPEAPGHVGKDSKTRSINDIIDKQKFAEKLDKLQKDIEMRNKMQDQREMELNQLQRDLHEQIIEISHQNSLNSASSRELTFQLKQLKELEKLSIAAGSQTKAPLPLAANPFRLNLRLNSQRGAMQQQPDLAMGNALIGDPHSLSNLNTDRCVSKRLPAPEDRSYVMNQNLVMSHRSAATSGQTSQNGRQRSQKRGNKNLNQKEVRQKQDLSKSACFHPKAVAASTPSSGGGLNEYSVSQLQNSEQLNNYGTEQNQFSLSHTKSSPIQNESGSVALRTSPQQTGLSNQAQSNLKESIKTSWQEQQLRHGFRQSMSPANEKPDIHLQAPSCMCQMNKTDRACKHKGNCLANSKSLVISSNDEDEQSQVARTPNLATSAKKKQVLPVGQAQVTDFQKVKIFGKNSNKNHEGNINLSTSSFKNMQILSSAGGTEKFGSGSKMGLNQRPLQTQGQTSLNQIYMTIGQVSKPAAAANEQIKKGSQIINDINSSIVSNRMPMFRTVSRSSEGRQVPVSGPATAFKQFQTMPAAQRTPARCSSAFQHSKRIMTHSGAGQSFPRSKSPNRQIFTQINLPKGVKQEQTAARQPGRPLKKLQKSFLLVQQVGQNKKSFYTIAKPQALNTYTDDYQMNLSEQQVPGLRPSTHQPPVPSQTFASKASSPSKKPPLDTMNSSEGTGRKRVNVEIPVNNGLPHQSFVLTSMHNQDHAAESQKRAASSYSDNHDINKNREIHQTTVNNASQLFDNSLLCCLTQAKKNKPVSRAVFIQKPQTTAQVTQHSLDGSTRKPRRGAPAIQEPVYTNQTLKQPFIAKRALSEQQKQLHSVGGAKRSDDGQSANSATHQQSKCLVQ